LSRFTNVALATCCAAGLLAPPLGPGADTGWAGWTGWTGALVDLPSALDRVAPELPDLHPPTWAERWLYNPRERTAAGLDALQEGRRDDGVEALDTALRQAPDDPLALYNAGTGRLFAEEQAKKATSLLERAADQAPPELAPRAFYNLGNARLAAGDAAGAAAAYRRSLRLEPSLRPAKRNLEIALARIDRDRPRAGEPEEAPGGERPGEEEHSDQGGGTEPPAEPPEGRKQAQGQDQDQDQDQTRGRDSSQSLDQSEQRRADAGKGRGSEQTDTPPAGPQGSQGASAERRELLRFDEQADMTAEEAAALLDAIDHLERTERRKEALARAAAEGESTEEDW